MRSSLSDLEARVSTLEADGLQAGFRVDQTARLAQSIADAHYTFQARLDKVEVELRKYCPHQGSGVAEALQGLWPISEHADDMAHEAADHGSVDVLKAHARVLASCRNAHRAQAAMLEDLHRQMRCLETTREFEASCIDEGIAESTSAMSQMRERQDTSTSAFGDALPAQPEMVVEAIREALLAKLSKIQGKLAVVEEMVDKQVMVRIEEIAAKVDRCFHEQALCAEKAEECETRFSLALARMSAQEEKLQICKDWAQKAPTFTQMCTAWRADLARHIEGMNVEFLRHQFDLQAQAIEELADKFSKHLERTSVERFVRQF